MTEELLRLLVSLVRTTSAALLASGATGDWIMRQELQERLAAVIDLAKRDEQEQHR